MFSKNEEVFAYREHFTHIFILKNDMCSFRLLQLDFSMSEAQNTENQ